MYSTVLKMSFKISIHLEKQGVLIKSQIEYTVVSLHTVGLQFNMASW